MVGKSNGSAMKGEEPTLTKLAPHWSLDEVAAHAVDFWLTTEDLPDPDNRVTVDGDGNVHLAYKSNNDEEAAGLYHELKKILNHVGMADHHVLRKNFYMKMDIPVAGCAHQAGTCRFGTDPRHVGARRGLQGPRARQPLRRRHQLLPQHRRREPGAHRDGQRDPGRRAHRRTPRLTPPDNTRSLGTENVMTTLTGKVAIVTGGNSGIGKAVVLALAEAGANIVIDYVANEQATEDLEKQVAALGDQSIGVEADVSKVEDLERLVKSAVDAFGRLDIMVNNAGVETRTSILDTTEAQYEKVMEINLKSAFFGTQLAAKQMIAQGDGGRIINITSVHEDWPMPGNTAVLPVEGRHAHAHPHGRGRRWARTASPSSVSARAPSRLRSTSPRWRTRRR